MKSTSSVAQVLTSTTMNNVNNNLTNNVQCSPIDKTTVLKADIVADKLEVALRGGEASRPFYCLVAYRLSESQIWNNLEQASRGNNPQKYFTWLCKRDMA